MRPGEPDDDLPRLRPPTPGERRITVVVAAVMAWPRAGERSVGRDPARTGSSDATGQVTGSFSSAACRVRCASSPRLPSAGTSSGVASLAMPWNVNVAV